MIHVWIGGLPGFKSEFVAELIGFSPHDHGVEGLQVVQVLIYSLPLLHKSADILIRSRNKAVYRGSYIVDDLSHEVCFVEILWVIDNASPQSLRTAFYSHIPFHL